MSAAPPPGGGGGDELVSISLVSISAILSFQGESMPRVRGERGGLELTTAALRAFTCCRERKKSCSSSSEEAEEPSALDDALDDLLSAQGSSAQGALSMFRRAVVAELCMF
jgi:hypothetical protein